MQATPLQNVYFFYHPLFEKHLEGVQHPECPDRLRAIREYFIQKGAWEQIKRLEPQAADVRWITTNHAPQYVQAVEQACRRAPALLDEADTVVTAESYSAALRAVGAGLAAVDAIFSGKTRAAFCAVRPPGHHAEYDHAMGFCLFNNVAIAANYAIQQHGINRVFILDWDVHHGNGTQHSFEDRADVFFCSIHQWPLYPGTGAASEIGFGEGKGYTLNIPLPAGNGDEVYFKVMREKVLPRLEAYAPDLILISAGFDAHVGDPLADMRLTTAAYAEMTRMIGEVAARISVRGIVSFLEGGYHLNNLAESVWVHLLALDEIAREL
ncbi:MAG: histone deacetylase [Calditrichaeota bacterium]|nr:histone deacetylase [Calditrichota bacterium]